MLDTAQVFIIVTGVVRHYLNRMISTTRCRDGQGAALSPFFNDKASLVSCVLQVLVCVCASVRVCACVRVCASALMGKIRSSF